VNISFVNHSLNEYQPTYVVPMLLDRVFILENYDGKETVTVSTTERTVVWLAFKLNSAFQEICAVWNSSTPSWNH
jgi:hypothetical protein